MKNIKRMVLDSNVCSCIKEMESHYQTRLSGHVDWNRLNIFSWNKRASRETVEQEAC
jgi:hypothetical protein